MGKNPIAESYFPRFFHYAFDQRVKDLKGRVSENASYTLNSAEIADMKRALNDGAISANLPQIKELIEKSLKNGVVETWMKKALHAMSKEKLVEICEVQNIEEMQNSQMKLKNDALKSIFDIKATAIFNELSNELFYFMDQTLNLFIEALGLRSVNTASNRWTRRYGGDSSSARFRLEAYLAVLLYPTVIFGYLMTTVAHAPTAFLITAAGTIATILFLIVYDRFLSPCPKQCEGWNNLNTKVMRGTEDPVYHREALLDQIESAFEEGNGALLLGETGTGKSAIVRGLAERILAKKCSHIIENAQIFETVAGSFGKMTQDSLSFIETKTTFDRHEKEVIPFLDEIHSAFKGKEKKTDEVNISMNVSADVSEDLKKFYDSFPYIIAATTPAEFDKYMVDEDAFLRRFQVIQVPQFNEKEIEGTLYLILHHRHPELKIEPKAMAYLCQAAPEYIKGKKKTSTLDAARSLLSRVMFKASHLKFHDLEKKISELKQQKQLLGYQLLHQAALINSPEYTKICDELKELEKQLTAKKQQLNELHKIEKLYRDTWRQGFTLVDQLGKQRDWLENQALVNLLMQAIKNYKEELGLPVNLNEAFIDQIVQSSQKTITFV